MFREIADTFFVSWGLHTGFLTFRKFKFTRHAQIKRNRTDFDDFKPSNLEPPEN